MSSDSPLLLLLCLTAWSGWFLFRASFVAGGRRVFCLFDDAMASMAYARNLVEGHGLNWARMGTPVEGFTHPLWTALMVPVNALPIDRAHRGLAVSLFSLVCLLANVLLVRRLTQRFFSCDRAHHWMPAALLTAFYYPLNYWALRGMESGLQALLVTASVFLALAIVHRQEDRHRELLALGLLGCLLRGDMLWVVAAIQAYVLWFGGLADSRRRKSWCQGLALLVFGVGGYALFRRWYFGDWLSNSYHLAFDQIPLSVRLMRGSYLLWTTVSAHLLLLVTVAVGCGLLARRDRDRAGLLRRMALPAGVFLVACTYSVVAGGDAGDLDQRLRVNRFVVYAMPLLFVLFNAILNVTSAWIAERVPADELARRFFVTVATVLVLAVADGLWLAEDPGGNWLTLLAALPPAGVAEQAELHGRLQKLNGALPVSGVLATDAGGLPAYFTDYRMVDLRGRHEPHIARLAPATPLRSEEFMAYSPGAVKADAAFVLGRYRPDAFLVVGADDRWRELSALAAAGYRHVTAGDFWLREPTSR